MDSIIQFPILSDVLAFPLEIFSFLVVFVKALSLVIQYSIVIRHYPFFLFIQVQIIKWKLLEYNIVNRNYKSNKNR